MRAAAFFLVLLGVTFSIGAQPGAVVRKPGPLLDPLRFADGRPVTRAQWPERRAQLLTLFRRDEFGYRPSGAQKLRLRWRVDEVKKGALGGLAVRKLVTIFFPQPTARTLKQFPGVAREMHLLLYTPAADKGRRVPVILAADFRGIWTLSDDPGVPLGMAWKQPRLGDITTAEHFQATEKERGEQASRWQIRMILEHGYGIASFYYGDAEPDANGGWRFSVQPLFFKTGQKAPGHGDWGALSVWAWALSKSMDYLETDRNIDPHRVAVLGHSRLGKAADWASATDPRFWMLISNEAGKGGDALIRRNVAESTRHLWILFPYWFTPAFAHWEDRDAEVPFDGNLLLALTAPRPLYVGSAEDDPYSDPEGEFLSVKSLGPLYRMFGKQGLAVAQRPPLNTPVMHTLGYHMRPGGHNITRSDWEAYLRFMNLHRDDPK